MLNFDKIKLILHFYFNAERDIKNLNLQNRNILLNYIPAAPGIASAGAQY